MNCNSRRRRRRSGGGGGIIVHLFGWVGRGRGGLEFIFHPLKCTWEKREEGGGLPMPVHSAGIYHPQGTATFSPSRTASFFSLSCFLLNSVWVVDLLSLSSLSSLNHPFLFLYFPLFVFRLLTHFYHRVLLLRSSPFSLAHFSPLPNIKLAFSCTQSSSTAQLL